MQEMQETQVRCLGWKDPLEKEMATHPRILVWEIPWTEEADRLYSSWGCRGSSTTVHRLTHTRICDQAGQQNDWMERSITLKQLSQVSLGCLWEAVFTITCSSGFHYSILSQTFCLVLRIYVLREKSWFCYFFKEHTLFPQVCSLCNRDWEIRANVRRNINKAWELAWTWLLTTVFSFLLFLLLG